MPFHHQRVRVNDLQRAAILLHLLNGKKAVQWCTTVQASFQWNLLSEWPQVLKPQSSGQFHVYVVISSLHQEKCLPQLTSCRAEMWTQVILTWTQIHISTQNFDWNGLMSRNSRPQNVVIDQSEISIQECCVISHDILLGRGLDNAPKFKFWLSKTGRAIFKVVPWPLTSRYLNENGSVVTHKSPLSIHTHFMLFAFSSWQKTAVFCM